MLNILPQWYFGMGNQGKFDFPSSVILLLLLLTGYCLHFLMSNEMEKNQRNQLFQKPVLLCSPFLNSFRIPVVCSGSFSPGTLSCLFEAFLLASLPQLLRTSFFSAGLYSFCNWEHMQNLLLFRTSRLTQKPHQTGLHLASNSAFLVQQSLDKQINSDITGLFSNFYQSS